MENGISNRCFKQNIHHALKKGKSINRAINNPNDGPGWTIILIFH